MKKFSLSIIIVLLLAIFPLFAGTYSGGSGTSGDPYRIATTDDLIELSNTSADWASGIYFLQTANILFAEDANEVDWDGDGTIGDADDAYGLNSIGNSLLNFNGNYNGQNHSILRLYISRPSESNIGLFGVVNGGTINNLGIAMCDIEGNYYVGGLVGNNMQGNISNCFTNGTIYGNGSYIGGFVGANANNINSCYSTCDVYNSQNTSSATGGFIGENLPGGTIINCFSRGEVSSEGSVVGGFCGISLNPLPYNIVNCFSAGKVSSTGSNVGGFMGFNSTLNGNINCYWDIDSSYQTTSYPGDNGASNTNMKTQSTFSGWDFNNTWVMSSSISFEGYPTLKWTGAYSIEPQGGKYIDSLPNLVWLAEDSTRWNSNYEQRANIDAWTTSSWLENAGWTPIGTNYTNFSGNYDGKNNIISNLYINSLSYFVDNNNDIDNIEDWTCGLFGVINSSKISNLGIVDANILGIFGVGALSGRVFNSDINNCYASGSIFGFYATGGLIGICGYLDSNENHYSTISKSYSLCDITSFFIAGGFIGLSGKSTINECYSNGKVTSNAIVGGFIGASYPIYIKNCYSNSSVQDLSNSGLTGAFCGFIEGYDDNPAIVEHCYATGKVFDENGDIWDVDNQNTKGFIGVDYSDSDSSSLIYMNNFFDAEAIQQDSAIGATAKTTAEMKIRRTFENWDFTNIWDFADCDYLSYPILKSITYDTPLTTPSFNPIMGLEGSSLESSVFVDNSFNASTNGWGITHFSDLDLAVDNLCAKGTLYIAPNSNTTYTGDIDFDLLTVILGDYDFELTGNITSGLIKTIGDGKLVMKSIAANTTKTFPISDGTYNYTVTFTTADNTHPDIKVKININNTASGRISDDFIDISGPENLNATITYRIDKASISPKTLTSISQIRRYDSIKNRYTPVDGNNASLSDEGSYYLITLTNVNKY